MPSTLLCKITKRTQGGSEVWEGTVSLIGAKPTKLVKSNSQESTFGTKSAVTSAAKNFARRYNANVDFGTTGTTSTTTKTTSRNRNRSRTRTYA